MGARLTIVVRVFKIRHQVLRSVQLGNAPNTQSLMKTPPVDRTEQRLLAPPVPTAFDKNRFLCVQRPEVFGVCPAISGLLAELAVRSPVSCMRTEEALVMIWGLDGYLHCLRAILTVSLPAQETNPGLPENIIP